MKQSKLRIYSRNKILIGILKRRGIKGCYFCSLNNIFRNSSFIGNYRSTLYNKRVDLISSLRPSSKDIEISGTFFIFVDNIEEDKNIIPIKYLKDIFVNREFILNET